MDLICTLKIDMWNSLTRKEVQTNPMHNISPGHLT